MPKTEEKHKCKYSIWPDPTLQVLLGLSQHKLGNMWVLQLKQKTNKQKTPMDFMAIASGNIQFVLKHMQGPLKIVGAVLL